MNFDHWRFTVRGVVMEWLRRPDPNRVRLVDRDGGMSVEKIVLDHYPERFTPEERAIARKTLNRQG